LRTGFLLLRTNEYGEAVAVKELPKGQLKDLGGECKEITLCPLEVSLLTTEEAQRLDEEIRSASPAESASWRDWCEATLRFGTGFSESVRTALVNGREPN
jgi:hypothetical protein